MDDLTQLMLQRAQAPAQGVLSGAASPPYSPPPSTKPHLPSAVDRWATAQKMINNYQTGNANPMITRITQ